MEAPELFIIAVGVFAYALFSRRGESGSLTGPMAFTLFGLAIGSAGLDLVDLPVENAFINRLAEITLVLALFTDASRIDVRQLDTQHDVPLRLLGIGLPLMMVMGTACAWLLFPSLDLGQAALLGVILAPTDAALGQAVVSNQRVPARVRQALNVESGLNDGLAFPVLLIAISLAVEAEAGRSAGGWGLFFALQVGLGPLVGLAVGWLGASLVEWATRRELMNAVFLQISVLSLAILAFAGAELVDGNGFIAAFTAGVVVGTRSHRLLEAIDDFGETEGQLLNLVVFLIFGAVLLPDALGEVGWRHLLYAVLSLTAIRLLSVALSLAGTRLLPSTVGFIGWFGPRGLASILYLLLVIEDHAVAGNPDITATVLVTVALSVLLHGATASPAARAYAARIARLDQEETGAERLPVFPFPTRLRPVRHQRGRRVP